MGAEVEPAFDVAVVGGGPAGLTLAIIAAQKGLRTVVVERQPEVPDKACGEGIMPPGLRVLERIGVAARIPSEASARITGIRYLQEDGREAAGALPAPGGLAVRRTALMEALQSRAREVGVTLRLGEGLRRHERMEDGVRLELDSGAFKARVLVAADGLASPLRHAEGLDVPAPGRGRFGLRQHFRIAPWTSFVEVHLAEGLEAYVTPCGPGRVGLAFLFERGAAVGEVSIASLLARFPRLEAQLAGAVPDSKARGAGPFAQRSAALAKDRFVLLGDAAGYVDAITGEGLSVALAAAWSLGEVLPEVLARQGAQAAFAPYERSFRRIFRRYAFSARALLFLTSRPWLRRVVISLLSAQPRVFEAVLRRVVDGWA